MGASYYYVDETYKQAAGYWHCNIGGLIIPIAEVIEAEIALEKCLFDIFQVDSNFAFREEFKYSSVFRSSTDERKLQACTALANKVSEFDLEFLVSHAKIAKRKVEHHSPFGTPQQTIQHLAHINISSYLAERTNEDFVQTIVDLGLSEAFKPVYEIYTSSMRGLKNLKAQGAEDDFITIPHYRRLLPPVFMTSQDSRLLQLSDLVIGLLLARETGQTTPFKDELFGCLAPLHNRIRLHSVEWNKDDT